ncbi:uncharacterized protein LOC130731621 [Lotus japonicus]|uniref:uncharacterized protein LOC130731621 n=1 Tax=Lotus japonicus TaxID=34305 RepID=UPI00258CE1D2|nr:uncharacterized protein LOC130731621 [Lotus japonicus]
MNHNFIEDYDENSWNRPTKTRANSSMKLLLEIGTNAAAITEPQPTALCFPPMSVKLYTNYNADIHSIKKKL